MTGEKNQKNTSEKERNDNRRGTQESNVMPV